MTDVAARRGRRTLLLLAVVFLGPMAVAMALYFTGFQWRPEATTEHGVLYRPARPVADLGMTVIGPADGPARLRGKWTLIYAGPGQCATDCREALVEMRQVRRALGRDMDRVQRLFLVTAGAADRAFLEAEHPGIGLVEDGAAAGPVLAAAGPLGAGDILLTDPLGNLVMRYPAGAGMKAIHEDLKRLLKVSTIG